jgi:hypothetical protein
VVATVTLRRFVIDFGYCLGTDGFVLPRRVVFRTKAMLHVDGEPVAVSAYAVPVGVYDEALDEDLPEFRYEDLEVME